MVLAFSAAIGRFVKNSRTKRDRRECAAAMTTCPRTDRACVYARCETVGSLIASRILMSWWHLPHDFVAGFDSDGVLIGTLDGQSHNFSATLHGDEQFQVDPAVAYDFLNHLAL